jgi:hypothetical protein
VPQALGSGEFLRVTWHETREVMVFSHWKGDRCVAATPVRVTEISELAALISEAEAHAEASSRWPPPTPDTHVVPQSGLAIAPARLSA